MRFILQRLSQFLHRARVEKRLFLRKRRRDVDLGLVGKVSDDGLVRLEATKDERTRQAAHHREIAGLCGRGLERLERAQETWIDEVENAPEVAHPVLHRRTGKRQAARRNDRPERLALSRTWIFYRLRLIRDDGGERKLAQLLRPRELPVCRQHEIKRLDIFLDIHSICFTPLLLPHAKSAKLAK